MEKPKEGILFPTQAHWADWLEANHSSHPGVWLRFAKKGSKLQSVSYAEAVEAALCYGWIDGQTASENAETYLQRFTPRTKRSIWSKINRQKALLLIEAGKMRPKGLEEITRAQADGRWDSAYDARSSAVIPPDFEAALKRNPKALAAFETLDGTNRYAFLFRIQTARRPETRARRIERFIAMLEKGETFHPQKLIGP
jgi:uncharacterized protein YdeI (YjbR/CyaY-like superfamily)